MIDGDQLPTLDAGRVSLRWLEDRDAPALYRIFSDAEAVRYWSHGPMRTTAQAAALLEDIRRLFRKRSLFQWGVVRRDDDAVIGTCTLAQLDPDNRRAEVGFILHPAYWRRGYMREALGALIGFAFGHLHLNRLEADVDPRNAASLALLEGLGFRREGVCPQRWIVGGVAQDSVILGLLAADW